MTARAKGRAPDTGETTAAINRRHDYAAWRSILPRLEAGRVLKRERTGRYYVDGDGSLTPAGIRRLEAAGLIRRVGVDVYALVQPAPVTS